MINEFLKEAYVKVGDMRRVFGQRVFFNNQELSNGVDRNINGQCWICFEEMKEIVEAVVIQDYTLYTDGVCDSLVTTLGLLHEVDNDYTMIADEFPVPVFEDLNVVLLNIFDFVEKISKEDKDYVFTGEDVTDIIVFSLGIFTTTYHLMKNLNAIENFNIIHETNMLKFFKDRMQAEKDVDIYRESGVNCNVVESEGYFLIKNESGKVLKPKSWLPPQLKIDMNI